MPQEWGQRAEIYLQGAVDSPDPRSSAVRGLGLSLALQGKIQDAAASWQTIPEMELELLQLGHHAREGKQYTLAMQWYTWAAAMQTDWRDPIYYTGLTLAEMGQGDVAIPYYEMAVSLEPTSEGVTNDEIYCELAWVYHWLLEPRNPQLALTYYDLALTKNEIFPSIDRCRFKRAELLMWSLHDFERAIEDYEILSQHQPQNVLVVSNLALARYEQTSDLTAAEVSLMALIENFPESPWGYWRLADVYREAGAVNQAREWYERTLLIIPGEPQLQTQLERLEQP